MIKLSFNFKKLNQVVAAEKTIKSQNYTKITEIDKKLKKPDLFSGFSRVYSPYEEEGEQYNPEYKKVQLRINDVLDEYCELHTDLIDITATKDDANCIAKSDIVVDGKVVAKNVCATTLLFLEKQLNDVRILVEDIPILNEAETWHYDSAVALHKTAPTTSIKTKKITKHIIVVPSTDKHPAVTDKVTEDVKEGTWEKIDESGAMLLVEKKEILKKVEKLALAVKAARESANMQDIIPVEIGKSLLNYIFQ